METGETIPYKETPMRRLIMLAVIALSIITIMLAMYENAIYTTVSAIFLLLPFTVICLTDAKYTIIPISMVAGIILIRIAVWFVDPSETLKTMLWYIISGIICGFLFLIPSFFGKKAGGGDIVLVTAIGFALGLVRTLFSIALMGVIIFILLAIKNKTEGSMFAIRAGALKEMIPFGPPMCIAAYIVILIDIVCPLEQFVFGI